ncbi:MAG: hypothetical protein ACRBCJ_00515 [Hyphomicrobiaceae bacterium]
MRANISSLVGEVVQHGVVTADDVQKFRAATYADGIVSDGEAELIFKANNSCKQTDPAWADFFVEAMTDYTVNQQEPEGYITAESAQWLIQKISADGKVDSRTELELLVNVLDHARWSPQNLSEFALEQVKHAVVFGDGPLRGANALEPGTITTAEVELLRRILYAFGGDANIAITQAEAEVLFEINDATAREVPNPAWTELFCKAILNSLMAHSGYAVPSREAALRSEAWLESRGELSLGGIMKAAVTKGLNGVMTAYREQSSEERAMARLERQRIEIITHEEITETEADWLIKRLDRDGVLTINEEALVDYITNESHKVHPKLVDFVAKFRRAA